MRTCLPPSAILNRCSPFCLFWTACVWVHLSPFCPMIFWLMHFNLSPFRLMPNCTRPDTWRCFSWDLKPFSLSHDAVLSSDWSLFVWGMTPFHFMTEVWGCPKMYTVRVFHFIHGHVRSFLLLLLIWQPACVSSLRRRGRVKKKVSNI